MLASPEVKYVDTDLASACDTAGSLMLLNGLAPGTAVNQRLGRRVTTVKLGIRLANVVTAGTGSDQFQRIVVVRDKQPNGAAPLATDFLISAPSLVQGQRNLNNAMRFVYEFDRTFHLNASAEPGSQRETVLDLPIGVVTQYNSGTAGTVADIATNSYYILLVGSQAPGVTAGSATGSCRCYFSDN